MRSKRLRLWSVLACLVLAVSACGTTSPSASSGPASSGSPVASSPAPSTSLSAAPATSVPPASVEPSAQQGGSIVVGLEADLSILDPHRSSGGQTHLVNEQIFEKLVSRDYRKPNDGSPPAIVPRLASSWDVSADGLTYTFHLRQGVKFHDGTPFNAAAVEFNIRRVWDKTFQYYIGDGKSGEGASVFGNVASLKVVDDSTIQVVLSKPFAFFIDGLASTTGLGQPWMQSPDSVKQYGDAVGDHPIGTGPFKFKEWVKGQRVVLDANRDYWSAPYPYLDKLTFVPIEDPAARVNSLNAGEVDLIRVVPPDQIASLQSAGFTIAQGPSPHVWFVEFNLTKKPFDDPKVRQAFSLAIDREGLAKDLLQGTAQPAICYCSRTSTTFNPAPSWAGYKYDPDQAKALLKEAGFAGGLKMVYQTSTSGSGQMLPVQMAEYIQRNEAAVGINMEIKTYEWNSYISKWLGGLSGDVDAGQMSWGDNDDFWLFNSTSPDGGVNSGHLKDTKYASLLAEANSTLDDAKRRDLLLDANKITFDEAYSIGVVNDTQPVAMKKTVQGYIPAGDWVMDFSTVWVAPG
jgi:peptide/nickel transport system substrate-binding protein